jgi:hypothetical protein
MNPLTAATALAVSALLVPNQQAHDSSKASFRFKMLHSGKQIGDASYERITTPTGRRTLLTINETVDGLTLSAVFDSTVKKDGTPEKKSFHGVLGPRPFSNTAVFTATGVDFVMNDANGGTRKESFNKPQSAVLADASETWFNGATPKKGDSATFTNFDIQRGTWEVTTTTYVGDEPTAVGTTTVTAHHLHVKSETGELDMFVDDNADIVVMDHVGQVRLERAD